MRDDKRKGYYLETWGGGRYTSCAWYPTRAEAEEERKRRMATNSWAGRPPIVVPVSAYRPA